MRRIFLFLILGAATCIFSVSESPSAFAVSPADYGLREGDLISASGVGDPDVYIVNAYGYKRLFTSPEFFGFYSHLRWDRVKRVSAETRDAFPTSTLIRNCETNDPKVFSIETTAEDRAELHWVRMTAEQARGEDPEFFKKVFCVNSAEFQWYAQSAEEVWSVRQISTYAREQEPKTWQERVKQSQRNAPNNRILPDGRDAVAAGALRVPIRNDAATQVLNDGKDDAAILLGDEEDVLQRLRFAQPVLHRDASQATGEYLIEFPEGKALAVKNGELNREITDLQQTLAKTSSLSARAALEQQIADRRAAKKAALAAHRDDLIRQQNDFLLNTLPRLAPTLRLKARFSVAFNGVHATLSDEEAKILADNGYAISPNRVVEASLADSVPLIGADATWLRQDAAGKAITGEGVTIAIVDTGVDYYHPDLGGCYGIGCKVIGGYDVANADADPMDDHGHGTHVAATAAGKGFKGVAPGANILAYKVLTSGGWGYASWIVSGIERALDPNGDGDLSDAANVISMSLGGSGNPDDAMAKASDNAVVAGSVVTIAAGNSGPRYETVGSPGVSRKAITVAASTKQDRLASFSSRGPVVWNNQAIVKPDIAAPGQYICAAQWDAWLSSAHCDIRHISISGTSMATPHIAGVAALMKQAYPEWSPDQIKAALKGTARELGWSPLDWGAGRVDAFSAATAQAPPPIAELDPISVSDINKAIRGRIVSQDLQAWSLSYSSLVSMSWVELARSTTGPTSADLAAFDTLTIPDGKYLIRLLVEEIDGQRAVDYGYAVVNKVDFAKPLNWDFERAGGPVAMEVSVHAGITPTEFLFEYGLGAQPVSWVTIGKSAAPSFVWDTMGLATGDYTLRVSMTHNGGVVDQDTVLVRLDRTLKPGWPVRVPWESFSCSIGTCWYWGGQLDPVVSDLDGDGKQEVIVIVNGRTSKIIVYGADGKQRWTVNPVQPPSAIGSPIPIVADLENDGQKEVLFVGRVAAETKDALYAFDANGQAKTGWPARIPKLSWPVMIAADLNGDKKPEFIIRGIDATVSNGPPLLVVVGADGREIAKWSLSRSYFDPGSDTLPAVGNFDDDADLEIVVAKASAKAGPTVSGLETIWNNEGEVHVFNIDGTELAGWPVTTNGFPYYGSSPIVGDVDTDGRADIIVGLTYVYKGWIVSWAQDSNLGGLYVFDRTGATLPGWPVRKGYSYLASPALGEADGQEGLEVAAAHFGYNADLYLSNGTLLAGWPQRLPSVTFSSALQAGVDAELGSDMLVTSFGSGTGFVSAWNAKGPPLIDFPKRTELYAEASASVADVEGNSRPDIAASSDSDWDGIRRVSKHRGSLYLWETDLAASAEAVSWPTFHHDVGRSGYLAPLPQSITVLVPNGGERWVKGTTQEIRWRMQAYPSDAKVVITLRDGVDATRVIQTVAEGVASVPSSYSWTIPVDILGGDYLVWIEAQSPSAPGPIFDRSDATFQIVDILSVSLTTEPEAGVAPTSVTLAADVGGSASGPIDYFFWWNCNDPETDSMAATLVCGDPADSTIGVKFMQTTDDPKVTTYRYAVPGTFSAKVIAGRGNATPVEARVTITILPPPDLVTETPTWSPDTPREGDTLTFSGIVRNRGGSASSASSARIRIDVGNDGTWDVTPELKATSALSVNASETKTWSSAWTGVEGTHKLEICADANGIAEESDETNNCISATFSVATPPPPPPAPPPPPPPPLPPPPPPPPPPLPPPPGGGGGGGAPPPPSLPQPTSPQPTTRAKPEEYGLREGDVISAVVGDPDVYIINEHGFKRLFLNPVIFGFYGHLGGWEVVKSVSSIARDAFITSGLFRNCEANDPKVYGVEVTGEDTGVLHWVNITAEQAMVEDPDFFKRVFCINQSEFDWYPEGISYTLLNQVPRYTR